VTAFDEASVGFLETYNLAAYKIASAEHYDHELLGAIFDTGRPAVISTGGGTWQTVNVADHVARQHDALIALLQCTATYPNQAHEVNLRAIEEMRRRYQDRVIGYSDHFPNILMAEAAYCHGARIIEKHVTINKAWKGPDHRLSIEVEELRELCHNLERLRVAQGDGEKRILPEETSNLRKMARSLYAARDIFAGEAITALDTLLVSPAIGLRFRSGTPNTLVATTAIKRGEAITADNTTRRDI
jgi:N-acetylneuraminate synthase/sialic acid synthase